jgi:hypothetical protein
VIASQLELISTDPGVMHGQVVPGLPVSVILDCLAAGMTTTGIGAVAAFGAALARGELAQVPYAHKVQPR